MDYTQLMYYVCFIELFILGLWGITAGRRSFQQGTLFPVVCLAWLALDGGLVRTISVIGGITGRVQPWPRYDASWAPIIWSLPLVLALVVTIVAAVFLIKRRPGKAIAAATFMLAVTAVCEGLIRLDVFSPQSVIGCLTEHPFDVPWVTIPANVVWVVVLASIILVRVWPGRPAEQNPTPAG